MASFLSRLFDILNRDLTGRTWTSERPHDYFSHLIYFGNRDEDKAYWEAQLTSPSGAVCVITLDGTPDGPLPNEVAFCRTLVSDEPGLLVRCAPVIAAALREVGQPVPEPLHLTLAGFSVPRDGDTSLEWVVDYQATGGDVEVSFVNGQPQQATFHR